MKTFVLLLVHQQGALFFGSTYAKRRLLTCSGNGVGHRRLLGRGGTRLALRIRDIIYVTPKEKLTPDNQRDNQEVSLVKKYPEPGSNRHGSESTGV